MTTSQLGAAFVTLVQPAAGHEAEYDRWYLEDHFYVGAMALPYWMAGKRWVATPGLLASRRGEVPSDDGPRDGGTFLGTYWILDGGFDAQLHALRRTVEDLFAQGRMFPHRRHVHTLYYDRIAGVRRRPDGPLDLQALDAEYRGLVMELVETDDAADRPAMLVDVVSRLPAELQRTGADLAVVMTPRHWPDGVEAWFDYGPVRDTQSLVLWFLTEDPAARPSVVADAFDRERSPLTPLARSTYVAAFSSHLPGRNTPWHD